MINNRLLIIAVILLVIGLLGVSVTAVLSPRNYRDASSMPGMMDREHMKEMMQRMMPGMLPPGIEPEDLPDPKSQGANLLVRYCAQCHYLPSPQMHTAEEWPLVANRMFARMSMMSGMMGIENPTMGDRQAILSYLKTHSLKSIAPGALPSPESQGAILFKEICSQCHSLPDPKLHTTEEWRKVLERMMRNMQAMGRKVFSDQERKEIVEYLSHNARK